MLRLGVNGVLGCRISANNTRRRRTLANSPSPSAREQAGSNASQIWGHINAGYLIAYEYTRWWKESAALRNSAVLGDWSWLNKTRITGKDAGAFMNYATVKDLAKQAVGQ